MFCAALRRHLLRAHSRSGSSCYSLNSCHKKQETETKIHEIADYAGKTHIYWIFCHERAPFQEWTLVLMEVAPFQGACFVRYLPRVSPWAVTFRPFGADGTELTFL